MDTELILIDEIWIKLRLNWTQDGAMTSWYLFGLNSSTGLTQWPRALGCYKRITSSMSRFFLLESQLTPRLDRSKNRLSVVMILLFSLLNCAQSFSSFRVGAEPGTNWFKVICPLCWWSVGNVLRGLEVDCRDMKYGFFVSTGINLTS